MALPIRKPGKRFPLGAGFFNRCCRIRRICSFTCCSGNGLLFFRREFISLLAFRHLYIAILFSLLFLFITSVHVSEHSPEKSKASLTESKDSFAFGINIEPLVFNENRILLKEIKILDIDSISNLNRLEHRPQAYQKERGVFKANFTLPYPLYTTFSTDHIFDSPLTPMLSPSRKAIYDLGQHGFTTKIIGLYIGQNSANNLPNSDNKAGFLGLRLIQTG